MNKLEIGNALVGNHIDGQMVAPSSGRAQDIFNPATGKKSGSVTLSSAAEVDAVVISPGT